MDLDMRFPSDKLAAIIEDMKDDVCACPAEVGASILAVRRLYATQLDCLLNAEEGLLKDSHGVMAYYSRLAHQQLEECLEQVIRIEGWNPQTLEMPPEIRKLRAVKAGGAAPVKS